MQDIRGKRLLLLGSSVWKDLIKSFADYYGVRLYFAGLYPAPLDDIVEEYYRIDTTDPEVMIPFVKEHKFDGVYMGGSEFIVSHACIWINELGLPCYCEKEQWDLLQDKSKFKDLCIKYGLPVVPKFSIDPNNIAQSVPAEAYPVITKPTDGSGSNGFSVCHNAEELEKGYKLAADVSPTGSVICEKFVNNTGLVVFFTFSKGVMNFVLSEDKIPVKYEKQGSYVAGLFTCPSQYENEFVDLYEDKLRKLFSAIGIREGTIWIEIFKEGNNFYFNEVGYRYGGSFSFYSVDYLSGINQFFADLYFATTGDSQLEGFKTLIPDNVTRGKHYCIYPVHCNPGKISKEEGLNEIRKKYGRNLVVVPYQKTIGDIISDTGSFGQVNCLFHFVYEEKNELKEILSFIQRTYNILDENGDNMVINKLNLEEI
jgi:formate-dependent phosphoribosylglycinamide formyltransferase (GAR transformylase)